MWFLLLFKKYWVTLVVTVLVSMLLASHWYMYTLGKTAERTMHELRIAQVREQARQQQEVLADELEHARQNRQVVVRDRIRYVDRVVDPAGCADVVIPDGVLEALGGTGNR